MKGSFKNERPPSAESIANQADDGQDISSYFTNDGRMMPALEIAGSDPVENVTEELNEK